MTFSIQEVWTSEKAYYVRHYKHEVNARRMAFNEVKAVYPCDSMAFIIAWIEWMISARVYTAVKKTKLGEQNV